MVVAISPLTIVVTGGTGLLGGAVLRQMAGREEILALCRPGAQPPQIDGVVWLEQDLVAPLRPDLPAQIDGVLHLAQSRRHREFPDGAIDTFAINAMATVRLLDYCRSAGGERFLYASSGAVYGSAAEPRCEDEPLAPEGFYAESKLAGERAVESFAGHFDVQLLRLFFVYGAEQDPGAFIPGIAARVREARPIDLRGDDGMRCNPIHVSEAAAATAAAYARRGSDVVNVAGPEIVSLRQIGEHIGELLGAAPVFASVDGGGGDMVADTDRMRERLIAPEIGVREGVRLVFSAGLPHPS